MMKIILGLSFGFHDAAAALVADGVVIAAAQEERFSGAKNDASYPTNAIDFCLDRAQIDPTDLEQVVFYERPLKRFGRILENAQALGQGGERLIRRAFTHWFEQEKFEVAAQISDHLGIPASKIAEIDHHQSHTASAYYGSPFGAAAVVTLDGVGERETATISKAQGGTLTKLAETKFPHSLGLFYSAFTAYLGFEVNEGEYKVMGMAAFGEPAHAANLRELITISPDGVLKLEQSNFVFDGSTDLPYSDALTEWLGPARAPESTFDFTGAGADNEVIRQSRHYADVAASVQKCTEDVIIEYASAAQKLTGEDDLCLAGGVALNSVANGRMARELPGRLFVQPAAGDAGGALGAALYWHHQEAAAPRSSAFTDPYLGLEFSDDEIEAAISDAYLKNVTALKDVDACASRAAELIKEGAVIGWFQGRAEWGPRALGNRSILADPRRADMKDTVNEKIKFREPFRPFAPSVLKERAADYFDLNAGSEPWSPERFMLATCQVHPEMTAAIPAIVHADGSARVHLVDSDVNPAFAGLIKAFDQATGVPMLLNTSFNLRGEPIVNSPADAIRTFVWCGMDHLVLGRHLISKDGSG